MQTKKRKIYINLMIAVLSTMLLPTNIGAQSSWMALHKPARNLVVPHRLEREISFLADSICQGRATGTGGNVAAAAWIAGKFQDAGLKKMGASWGQSFVTEKGVSGHNIIGMLPGSDKARQENYMIIGAHYDHLGTIDGRLYPGADSNASGVVTMTTLAQMLSMTRSIGKTYGCSIIFVAFDGKEHALAGSRALWDRISSGELTDPVSGKKITKDRISLMVNIDQIGSVLAPLNEEREDYLIMLDGYSGRSSYRDVLQSCNTMYEIGLDLGFTYYGSANFTKLFYRLSDQKVFIDNRIPSILFTSGITMNNNKPRDTASTLNMEVLHKRIYLIYHWLVRTL